MFPIVPTTITNGETNVYIYSDAIDALYDARLETGVTGVDELSVELSMVKQVAMFYQVLEMFNKDHSVCYIQALEFAPKHYVVKTRCLHANTVDTVVAIAQAVVKIQFIK
jgi:hypothetical protein